MDRQAPVAFLSYVRADDEHDHGKITALRSRLEGEIRMHTGQEFKIFQDKRDLSWGQHWKTRLDDTLLSVTFLIPVITPSYFNSSACRDEFEKFSIREKQLGENRLILPIYYLSSDPIADANSEDSDEIAKILASRNWADWRHLRFKDVRSPEVESAVAGMANTVKIAMRDLEAVIAASKTPHSTASDPLPARRSRKSTQSTTRVTTLEPSDMSSFTPVTPVVTEAKSKALKSILLQSSYKIYTKEYDEIINPESISSPDEMSSLKSLLIEKIFFLKELNEDYINEFRKKFQPYPNNPSMCLLLDNSGSMRGTKIETVAAWSCIISELLREKNIDTEVLGFTTRAWKGGNSRDKWISDGKPEQPGRLNDLRHIIYKSFSDDHETLLLRSSIMIREGILKENVDGEALIWAAERMEDRSANESAILVFSDGAPVDDSTLSVNDGHYLENHLLKSIKWVQDEAKIAIHGAGLEYDVARYYKSSTYSKKMLNFGRDILAFLTQKQTEASLFSS